MFKWLGDVLTRCNWYWGTEPTRKKTSKKKKKSKKKKRKQTSKPIMRILMLLLLTGCATVYQPETFVMPPAFTSEEERKVLTAVPVAPITIETLN